MNYVKTIEYDIAVAGGGVAGVAAAVEAARSGKKVVLIEKATQLGGLATIGLINLFVPMCNGRGTQIIKGMADEFLRLSIRYGFDTIPQDWKNGEPGQGNTQQRLISRYSAPIFSLVLCKPLRDVNVDILFDTVIDRIGSDSIPHDDDAFARLQTVLGALEINVPAGAVYQPRQEDIDGVTYTLSENRMGMTDFTFEFHGSTGLLTYQTTRGVRRFPFCMGRYADTTFPETHYFGKRIRQPKGEEYRCLNCAVWEDENTLLVRTYIIDDYFGNMAARFVFDGDTVSLNITKTAEWFLDEYVGTADGAKKG